MMSDSQENTSSAISVTTGKSTRWLTLYVFFILLSGSLIAILSLASGDKSHWMEAPVVALMMCFMPLTAISFLHFRLPKKQDEFLATKRALQLDNDNAESMNAVFEQNNSSSDYLLPIIFVSILSMLGFYILVANYALVLFNGMEWIKVAQVDAGSNLIDFTAPDAKFSDIESYRRGVVAIGMAFLGSFVWSIQYIFRRMITLDLPPGAYYNVGSRIVYSAFLAVVIEHFIVNAGDMAFLKNQIIAISFLIGIFPNRALAWMKESLGKIFADKKQAASELPLEMLEGISGFHKARLQELGIDNVQNLAQSSLLELILKTPFTPRVLIDWMAQARLCLEFKDNTEKVRAAGCRTILDFLELCAEDSLLQALAVNSGLEESLIKTIYHNNKDEISVSRLRQAYDKLNVI